ncbi:rhodanese-like domain-containing protein [Propionivibrio dicarboxylicus]|uniref:3-mercaptopyruvate sulfurtransferase SseA, contains two rhodanese domains n=1 Tax=Propionivibrio dicarboxylicus TaxID=83767 RepID=A0A1G7WM18_9RHOO|nr:rhodanese-like domain-containing protein [Propionivibrio dicarboxylicus]SDG72962.1 3-mercaptopyruvate sulfurtransferase SseA, contains two rhodanese domains [Propionivibrio dicarboxylicus]
MWKTCLQCAGRRLLTGVVLVAVGFNVVAADLRSQPREGWYVKGLAGYDEVRGKVDIPPVKDVMIIDSRPAARQFDPGHIPGAINIPDSQFDKLADKLPADKSALLIFYCGGVDCMLSHNSAFKAEKLGYAKIMVYAEGMPDWKERGEGVSVSAAYIKKLIDDKAAYALIDARPRRVAEKGMIPTAINIPDSEFDKHLDKLPADKATQLIYYCGGLDCVLSDKSAAKAKKLGYANVVTYPEGYPEWEKLAGAGAAKSATAAATASADGAALAYGKEKGTVTVESFEKVWKSAPQSIHLVDVRDLREFNAGTIKGAVNIPVDDLDAKVASLPTDKPVIFFCATGARSGEAYDTVKAARADVKAFFLDANIKFAADGSYTMKQK